MRKSSDIQLRLEQSFLLLDRKELLNSKQSLALSRLTNSADYDELRQWLLRISVLFFDKAGYADQTDSFILVKFGRFLKDLVGDMDGLKEVKKEEQTPETPYGE